MMSLLIFLGISMIYISSLNYKFILYYFQVLVMLGAMYLYMIFPLNSINDYSLICMFLGMDVYSWVLILLSMWIINLGLMTMNLNMLNMLELVSYLLMLMIILIMSFYSMDFMMFYVYFEISLIPIFMIILKWGVQFERMEAGLYLMLYTLVGSVPLLVILMKFYFLKKTLVFMFIEVESSSLIMYMSGMLAFLIKMPMFFFHLWLPKAHVEAPLIGSMILAGIMLKLGSYGLMRMVLIMSSACFKFNKYLIILSLMGGVYSSLICMNQVDMKILVAYSSVVHMGLLMAGILTMSELGMIGGVMMMISHGICSSGLFFLVNLIYERTHSRSLLINKGLINYYPSLTLMWFLICSSSVSFPFSLSMFSEILLVSSLVVWSKLISVILIFMMFFGAYYILYLYSFSQHGHLLKMLFMKKTIKINDYMLVMLHWLPLNYMFMIIYVLF